MDEPRHKSDPPKHAGPPGKAPGPARADEPPTVAWPHSESPTLGGGAPHADAAPRPASDRPTEAPDASERPRAEAETHAEHAGRAADPKDLLPGVNRIGAYRVLGVVGVGGMGVVYRAEQTFPNRVVALKVIRPGLFTPALLRRFEHEAEVLGRLQHPGIAAIYEAGTAETRDGVTPYFAMEFVQGRELSAYLEEERPNARRIASLFARICDAVQHAHTKGVIHRDLKPSNVLVDHSGQPKILDFGVARATDADVQAVTLETSAGMLIGTVPYMSPEQVAGDPGSLDTRSDVYTLGVLLFEAFTGRLPHDLDQASIISAARTIIDREPLTLAAVDPRLRGDLSTIVAKALERDRDRRYQSAADLGADLRRYLNDEPISARPPSTIYQFRKFARRNKGLVTAAAAIVTALVAVAIVSVVLLRVAQRERDDAEAVLAFLSTMLRSPDPSIDGRDVRMVDVLAKGSAEIDQQFADQPGVAARLHERIGETYYSLGELEEARAEFVRTHEILRATLGPSHFRTLLQLNNLAVIDRERGDLDAAAATLIELVELERRRAPESRDLPLYLDNLGEVHRRRGNLEAAEGAFREALDRRLEIARAESDPERRAFAERRVRESSNNLALTLRGAGRLAEARDIFARLLQEWNAVDAGNPPPTPGPSPGTLTVMHNLALVRAELGDFDEAIDLQRRVLERRRELLGETHRNTLFSGLNLASTLRDAGELDEAEALLVEAAEAAVADTDLGADHSVALRARLELAELARRQGDAARARDLARAVLVGSVGRSDPLTLRVPARLALGRALLDLGETDEATEELRLAADELMENLGPRHWRTADARCALAVALLASGRTDEARALAPSALRRLSEALGETHWRVTAARADLAPVNPDAP